MEEVQRPHFKVIAHRGNSSQAPENTYASFQQSIQMNVDFIECDVQLTKDLVPIVMHDSTIHRILANSEVCEVSALRWDQLKNLDAGSWFDSKFQDQRILSLREFLAMPRGKAGAMIEVKKDTFNEKWMTKIAADIMKEASNHKENVGPIIIGSLSPEVVIWLQDHMPGQTFISIVKYIEDFDVFFKQTNSKYFGLRYNLATPERIRFLRDHGKEVWVWTVDDKDSAIKFVEDGVQGIITNHPKKIQHMHLVVEQI
jgi:glycerophosphoryl diester phosphodiesterase